MDWLATDDAVIMNEVSVEGISATYYITVQQCVTTALFNTSANLSVISQKFFDSLPQKLKLLILNSCTVTSASITDITLI